LCIMRARKSSVLRRWLSTSVSCGGGRVRISLFPHVVCGLREAVSGAILRGSTRPA